VSDAAGSPPVVVGVALAIPEPHASVLLNWRRRVGDEAADKIPPHVTLLPPTEFAVQDLPALEKHLEHAATAVGGFTVRLSGTGTFRPISQVVFVQVSAGISECELLERAVRSEPIHRELDFPYHPHVTVAHDLADVQLDDAFEGLADFVAQFPIDSLVMYQRDDDGRWRVHREFALTGA
jgi:2'-5' RNA ligase